MIKTLLVISIVLYISTIILIKIKSSNNKDSNKFLNKISYVVYFAFVILTIWSGGLLLKSVYQSEYILDLDIRLEYFDYLIYIGFSIFFPTLSIIPYYFENINEKRRKSIIYIYILPIISIILLFFTNNFKVLHSLSLSIMIIYSLVNYIIFILKEITTFTNKIGGFSKYILLIIFIDILPLLLTLIWMINVIDITAYMSVLPILVYISLLVYLVIAFSDMNLKITHIALDTVTNSMSDSFVVVSCDGTILEYNRTFLNTFKNIIGIKEGDNFFEIIREKKIFNHEKLIKLILEVNEKIISRKKQVHLVYKKMDRYFDIDICPITTETKEKKCIGILLLIKDITQHKLDIKQIKQKQEVIVKQGQLASIGEIAGGVAHDINTPISAIKTGVTLLKDMKEDRSEDEEEVLGRIDNCADKIINIVNSMRNQIRNLGGTTNIEFKISSVLNDVKTITYHEIKKNNSVLEANIIDDVSIKGDPTKFGQVLTNLILNSVQAYEEKGGKVIVTIDRTKNNKAIVKIMDFAGGLSKDIAPYIFKNILTTKGTFGTGLGLYVSYSVIKGEFNGDIVFNTEEGIGTTFIITVPIKENKKE